MLMPRMFVSTLSRSILAAAICTLAILSPLHAADPAQKPVAAPKSKPIVPLATFGPYEEWAVSTAVSPDGRTIATGTYDSVRLHSAESLTETAHLKTKLGRVRSLAFTPDGNRLIAGGFRRIVVWDAATHAVVQELSGHRGYVTGLAVSPDGSTLASSSEDTTLRLWTLGDGSSRDFHREEEDPVMAVAFSPDGKQMAVATGDDTRPTRPGHVLLFDVASGKQVHELEAHARAATTVAFSPDGSLLASGAQDEMVHIYSVSDGKLLRTYEEHGRPVNRVRFINGGSADVVRILSAAGGRATGRNEAHVWNAVSGETIAVLDTHQGPVFDIDITPDHRRIVTVSRDGSAIVWDSTSLDATSTQSADGGTASSGSLTDTLNVAQKLLQDAASKLKPTGQPANTDKDAKPAPSDTPPADNGPAPNPSGECADNATATNDTAAEEKIIRIGMIGLDTSHCIAFTKILNDPSHPQHVSGCRVVAVYPKGSPDIESSTSRVPGYTEQITALGVVVENDLEALVAQSDAILLETNDGRPHLEQVIPALKAGKPVFIDKPIAGSLMDAVAIFELSRHYNTPLFSSSSLRFASGAQALRKGSLGEITGCDTYSPCSLEKTHPDLFWYGIHGVEMLFTVMGTGVTSVTRTTSANFDQVTGLWNDGRIGTFRGIRSGGGGYGGTAFGTKGVAPVGQYDGYAPLVVEIVKFFKTREVPVGERETLEIYAFMEAADESKRNGGRPVLIETVLETAHQAAAEKVKAVIGLK